MSSPTLVSPPVTVFVPTRPLPPGADQVEVQLRQVDPGVLVVLAYRSLDALLQGCGPAQSWASLPAAVIEELTPGWGAVGVLLDVPLAEADRLPSA